MDTPQNGIVLPTSQSEPETCAGPNCALSTGSASGNWERAKGLKRGWKKWNNWKTKSWVTLNPDGACYCGCNMQPLGRTLQSPEECMRDMDALAAKPNIRNLPRDEPSPAS